MTKVDRIEQGAGAERKWLELLYNQENTLPNGWYCVKQPSPEQLRSGITRREARDNERAFFEDTPPWSLLAGDVRDRLGSAALTDHLSRMLADLVAEK